MLLGRSLGLCWICLLLFSSTSGVPLVKDGNLQLARQSPPGPQDQHSVQQEPPELRQQNVRLENYGTLKTPASGTGQQPSRDVVGPQTKGSAGLPIASGAPSYQAAPVSYYPAQHGYDGGSYYTGVSAPGQASSSDQQAGGARQQFNTYSSPYMDVAAEVPQSVGRVSQPRRLYISQSNGGFMHASEQMSHSKYDPDDRHMSLHAFGTAEIPSWFAPETQGQSGSSTQGSQQTNGGYPTAVQNMPVSSPGNSQQTQHNYYRESQNPEGFKQVPRYYVAPGQNLAGGPGPLGFGAAPGGLWTIFPNPARGNRNAQQSQDYYGTAVQRVPIGSQSAQQTQADYQRAVQNSQNMFAQGFRQKV
ncbi:uncharacterized protein LOC142894264 [Nelusetta ayraudi]|uniref:uncharacterized protein LOC142894264 n=1 Tax=Nelusetta ayraudi TaxID=303726 RepID=UPI003F7071E0